MMIMIILMRVRTTLNRCQPPGAVEERGGARDPLEQGQVAPCEQGLLLLGEIHQNDQLPHLHIRHHNHHQDQQQFTKDYLFSV